VSGPVCSYMRKTRKRKDDTQTSNFKLDSVEKDREILKRLAVESMTNKLQQDLADMTVTMIISLATRIRFVIMKAIAKRIELKEEMSYVRNYLLRPILHINRGTTQVRRCQHVRLLTFTDAVCQYGRALKPDLAKAYKKLGLHCDAGRELEGDKIGTTQPRAEWIGQGPRARGKKRMNEERTGSSTNKHSQA